MTLDFYHLVFARTAGTIKVHFDLWLWWEFLLEHDGMPARKK